MALLGKKENSGPDGGQRLPRGIWVRRGLLLCFFCALLFSALYGMFRARVMEKWDMPLETEQNAGWLYQNTFVLFRDLYNRQNQVREDYSQIYLEPNEGYEWILDKNLLVEYMDSAEEYETAAEEYEPSVGGEAAPLSWEDMDCIGRELTMFDQVFQKLEDDFGVLNGLYNYCIRDDSTGFYVTNMTEEELAGQGGNDFFRLSFVFDSAGNASVKDIVLRNGDAATLRSTANQALKNTQRFDKVMLFFQKFGTVRGPRNCTVTYSVTADKWNSDIREQYGFGAYNTFGEYMYSAGGGEMKGYMVNSSASDGSQLYRDAGVSEYLLFLSLVVFLAGLFLPVLGGTAPWRDRGVCTWCPEFLILTGCGMLAASDGIVRMVAEVASGRAAENLGGWYQFSSPELDTLLVWAGNCLALTLFFFAAWYLGVCARAVRESGIRTYIRERSAIWRFVSWNRSAIWRFLSSVKSRVRKLFDELLHIDLTKKVNNTILKLVIVNALILFLICTLWFGGIMVTLIYSAVLYLILRKYTGALQKRYRILLKALDEMAEGNLNVAIEEDLGVFEPLKPQILKIQNGFKKAVDEEVKSQRMKAELITNVSHDLKTPLTAIITYVNLMKDPALTEEQREEYLDTLERKSLRLKVLIEDLFEVSKANSGNITLNLMPVDVVNLVRQVHFEMKDKLEAAGLDVRMNLPDEKMILPLDSQKTYRIYENLFGNVAKYALRGTRVYVNGFRINDTIVITIKNISAQELTVDASELTERFVRGDISRNTEGSGLGLAIAKSFVQLQGGRLELEVDGDLFKATTVWQIK